jgi:AcrR family transcriptional regulator
MPSKDKVTQPSRERILAAALNLFMRNGYSGTSLSSIAKTVGVSTPALYWHFSSKDEIYYTAIDQFLKDFINHVRGAITSTDPANRLAELVTAHVTWQLEQADIASAFATSVGMRQLVAELPPGQRDTLVELQRGYVTNFRDVLIQGNEHGVFDVEDISVTAFGILSMCEYVHTWYNPEGPLNPADVAERYVKLALRMAGATLNKQAQTGEAVRDNARS